MQREIGEEKEKNNALDLTEKKDYMRNGALGLKS